jgi:hypothetical protein
LTNKDSSVETYVALDRLSNVSEYVKCMYPKPVSLASGLEKDE